MPKAWQSQESKILNTKSKTLTNAKNSKGKEPNDKAKFKFKDEGFGILNCNFYSLSVIFEFV